MLLPRYSKHTVWRPNSKRANDRGLEIKTLRMLWRPILGGEFERNDFPNVGLLASKIPVE